MAISIVGKYNVFGGSAGLFIGSNNRQGRWFLLHGLILLQSNDVSKMLKKLQPQKPAQLKYVGEESACQIHAVCVFCDL